MCIKDAEQSAKIASEGNSCEEKVRSYGGRFGGRRQRHNDRL
jgi:hypothetical protein